MGGACQKSSAVNSKPAANAAANAGHRGVQQKGGKGNAPIPSTAGKGGSAVPVELESCRPPEATKVQTNQSAQTATVPANQPAKESRVPSKQSAHTTRGNLVVETSATPAPAWNKPPASPNGGHTARSFDLPAELKKQLREVANENYEMRNRFGRVPRTAYVQHEQCRSYADRRSLPSFGTPSRVTVKSWSTADALLTYASAGTESRVCGLNFANGKNVGGGYKAGSMAQEEDLCRRMPTLYTSLYQASREGAYPFGPSTCTDVSDPQRYMDVLYTPGVVIARAGLENQYVILPKPQQLQVDLVSAAAPNINFAKELFDPELVYGEMVSILLAPKLQQPRTDTLVLGAWGCGAFGCDPAEIGGLFGKVLSHEGFGRLYREVHFAIPEGENCEAVKAGLRRHKISFQEL